MTQRDHGRKRLLKPAATSRSLPLHTRLSVSDSGNPQFFNWESSMPVNWMRLSPRPVKRIPGLTGFRSTIDFLMETQKYITQITERRFDNSSPQKYPVSRLRPTVFHTLAPARSEYWKLPPSVQPPVAHRAVVRKKRKRVEPRSAKYVLVGV